MRGIFSPDFTLKVINDFQKFIEIIIKFFDKQFGVFGKYILSPAIRLIAISLYSGIFIVGVTVYISILLLTTLIRKIHLLITYSSI